MTVGAAYPMGLLSAGDNRRNREIGFLLRHSPAFDERIDPRPHLQGALEGIRRVPGTQCKSPAAFISARISAVQTVPSAKRTS
jgi:hypothetical protein